MATPAGIGERLLQEAQELFRCVFNDSSDAFVISRRADLRILDANPAFEQLTCVDRTTLLSLEEGLLGLPLRRDDLEAITEKLFSRGGLYDEPLTITPTARDRRLTRLSATIIELSGQQCVLCALRDMTALVETQEQRNRAVNALLSAEESIRAELALDLHDDTLQVLTAAGFELDRIERGLREQRDDERAAAVTSVRRALSECADRTRRLMFQLRPRILAAEGLGPALNALARVLEQDGGPEITVDAPVGRYAQGVEELVWRTVREALVNVRKHASATHATVALRQADGALTGQVRDDGSGFDVQEDPGALHIGISSMRERIEGLGGTFAIDSVPGSGTTLRFAVPASSP